MSSLTPGTTLRNRYRVVRKLGEGGMGEVYLVKDRAGMPFAAKLLKEDMPERFIQESMMLAKLEHPNIVRVYDTFAYHRQLMFIMEYIPGESLAARIRNLGRLSVSDALSILAPVLLALDYANQKGVIHRDVKPSNILIDECGVPQLCDFGIARQIGERRLTKTGVSLGTPEYMSPEQIQAPPLVDFRSDMYSAGVVLYEMLCGRVPFYQGEHDSLYELLRRHVNEPPPDPRRFNPDIDRRMVHILERALAKKPEQRFQGGREFREALEHYRLGRPLFGRNRVRRFGIFESSHNNMRAALSLGFSWSAFAAGPLWFGKRGMRATMMVVLFIIGLMLLCSYNLSSPGWLVSAVLAWCFIPALFANGRRRRQFERRGYRLIREVRALSAEQALRQ